MIPEGTLGHPAPGRLGTLGATSLVALVGLATILAGAMSGGDPILTLAPALLAGLGLLLTLVPVRWPTTILILLLLSLEVKNDAAGIWSTPLIHLGELLRDLSTVASPLKIAGFEAIALVLLGIAFYRGARGSSTRAPAPSAAAVRDCIVLYLAGVLLSEVVGLARGLSVAPWKVRYLLWVPFFYLLFQLAYRRTRDFAAVGIAVVAAAHLKAMLAIWVQEVAAPQLTGGELAYATNHGDSVLFVMAIVIVVAQAMEGVRWPLLRLLLLVPLPVTGMVLNRRRIAWAMLELSLALMLVITPWRRWKRRLATIAIFCLPVILIYVAVGWNTADSRLFGPVHKIRTMIDGNVDPSTYWRDIETWNIASTIRHGSPLGTGLGGEYVEYMKNDDISSGYPDYRRWPHNTVLGLLLLAGPLAFAAIWFLYPATIFLAVRAYHLAWEKLNRVAALASVAAIACCCVMAWGDTGLAFRQATLAFALALAVVGKLAASTGAWPSRGRGGRGEAHGWPTRRDAYHRPSGARLG